MNLMSGVLAIVCALAGRIDVAPWLLLLSALFDFLDGLIARKMNLMGELGKQLDSLADMVSFGLAPGIIMLVVLVLSLHGEGPFYINDFASNTHYELQNWINAVFYGVPNRIEDSLIYLPFVALVIPFFSMFRLAKFNIDDRQTDSFIGVPTPLNTIFFMFFPLFLNARFSEIQLDPNRYEWFMNSAVLCVLILGMSYLLIAEIPLISLKFKRFSWTGNEMKFIFLVCSALLIFTMFVWSIPLIVFLYLIVSLVEQQRKRKKNKNEVQSGN
jgi:CDP-diacylglycerol--serine O-phosphatidyltransferase